MRHDVTDIQALMSHEKEKGLRGHGQGPVSEAGKVQTRDQAGLVQDVAGFRIAITSKETKAGKGETQTCLRPIPEVIKT